MNINQYRVAQQRSRAKFGAINLSPTGQPVSPKQGAAQGAAAGSAFGPWGTVVGAAVGTVVGLLSAKPNTAGHIGGWDTQIAQAVGSLPSSGAGVGRQIPWNENSHGLCQFLESLLATGLWMGWDPSLISNYSVCTNWTDTFSGAVISVMKAIAGNPAGAQVSLNIAEIPGTGPIPFSFVNPGLVVGPDAIAAKVIMGNQGVVYALIARLDAPHASITASNALAQKVFAYMCDYQAAQLAPVAAQPTIPAPVIAPAVTVASTTVNASVAAAPPTPPAPPPVQPANPVPVPTSQPTIVVQVPPQQTMQMPAAAPAASSGLSTMDLLLIGGLGIGALLILRK